MRSQQEYVLRTVEERAVRFVQLWFTDVLGTAKTFSITPSYSYNSKNSYLNPSAGKSIFFSIQASGSILGANVNTIHPTFDGQYYHISPRWRKNIIAVHLTYRSRLVEYAVARMPAQRPGEPSELVGPALLLASDAGSFINGVVLPVDGGHTVALV
jgi:hypothetical protein